MPDGRYRVLLVASHPVQYAAPLFRQMAQHPRLDPLVAYCNLQGAESRMDPEFGVEVRWDVPLLEGYPWVQAPNRGIWKLIRSGEFDAVILFTGYRCVTFWVAAAAAKSNHTSLLFGTDAHELRARDGSAWKARWKRLLWPALFRLADVVIVPSTAGRDLMRLLGIRADGVIVTPYVVDNDWWIAQAGRVDRAEVRRGWNIPEQSPVVLFCAKLQPWKRPLDVLKAFAQANVPDSYLVYAGEGPMREQVAAEAHKLGMDARVRLLGFVNQSQLPGVYCAADLLVLPSEYEPFGVVVNEAMLCGCAVVASDRVGAAKDLIRAGENGFVFPCGDVDALARIFREFLLTHERLREMGRAARRRMESWSPHENIAGLVRALEKAVGLRPAS